MDVSSLTPEGAKQVIRERYWDVANCNQEPTQELVTICLDTAVGDESRALQRDRIQHAALNYSLTITPH